MPFWAWNNRLEKDELRRQIAIFREMGFGGFFMHSRVGLDVPYLQEEFFEYVKTCVDEAKKQSLEVWLYDEDRWPSGTAGGIVTGEDKFKMRAVYLEKAENSPQENILELYAVKFNSGETDITSYRKVTSAGDVRPGTGEVLCCAYWAYMQKRAWFNGECYLDTLNKDAVKAFIGVTHEAYAGKVGEEFGKQIRGIFTDEMGLSVSEIGCGIPYTAGLTGIFQERYGYDFLEYLPELFYSCSGKVSKVRYDFMNLVTELFVRATAQQMGEWCEAHDLQLTGHIFNEDTLTLQYCFNGAAMRFYEYMQSPGIDVLTEHWNLFMTVKQCVSVARQFGKKERCSESYACTGWDFPLSSHKALGDWQFALGINKLVPHIAWYTMKGEAKRDYPASISFQSPWYRKYPAVCDYFARLKVILENQQEIRDILFIHPIESLWSCLGRNEAFKTDVAGGLHPLERQFAAISQNLLAAHLDYDYGDEELLGRIGKVAGDILYAGHAEYRAILLPELKTIRKTTLDLLDEFTASGGKVFYLGDIPEYVQAEKSDLPRTVYQKFTAVTMSDCIAHLRAVSSRVSMTDANGSEISRLLYLLGKSEKGISLFVTNFGCAFAENIFDEKRITDRKDTFPQVRVTLACDYAGNVCEIDPESGNIYPVDAVYADGRYCFETSFGERETKLFFISPEKPPLSARPPCIPGEIRDRVKLDEWDFELTEPNVLVLDQAELTLRSVQDKTGKYILEIDEILRKEMGLAYRGDSMMQPYCRNYTQEQLAAQLPFELTYRFRCSSIPEQNCFLALEDAAEYQIYLNGHAVDNKVTGWWVDPAISCVPLNTEYFVAGNNILQLAGKYHCTSSGLESIYIIGNFGVSDDAIGHLPEKMHSANWCTQALPYYSGNVIFRRILPHVPEHTRVFLKLSDWRGSALGIRVNSGKEIDLSAKHGELEITPWLSSGNNMLEITVYGHRKNSFGPFYLREKQPFWNDSRAFRLVEKEQRNIVPCGLCGGVELLFTVQY